GVRNEEEVMSSLIIKPLPVPLAVDAAGDVRIAGQRILLDYVVEEFENGASPEAIVETYDTLKLAEVYAVLAYYLAYQDDVKTYMTQRRKEVEEQYERDRARPESATLRGQILARRAAMEQGHAAPAQ